MIKFYKKNFCYIQIKLAECNVKKGLRIYLPKSESLPRIKDFIIKLSLILLTKLSLLKSRLIKLFAFTNLFNIAYMIIINPAYAINAETANTIQGYAPYLTIDGGSTKITDTSELLGITLSDGTLINALNDVSSSSEPIELPNLNDTYADIQTIVPLYALNNNYPFVNVSDLLQPPFNYFGDDDGDGYDINGNVIAVAKGKVTVKWEMKDPAKVNINDNTFIDITSTVKDSPNQILNLCDGPYKLTISSTNVQLNTTYGVPNESNYVNNSHSYFIIPKLEPKVCYSQPNLVIDSGSLDIGTIGQDGPSWDSSMTISGHYRGYPSKGYKVISPNNSGHYDGLDSVKKNNFPSTGSHGLYFYLLLKGITPDEVLIANGSTIKASEGGNVNLQLSNSTTEEWSSGWFSPSYYGKKEPALKVLLDGPRYNSTDKSFKPSTFKLYADSSKTKLLYEFKLMRWYIAQPLVEYMGYGLSDALNEQSQAKNYCLSLGNGYRLPDMNDFTNSNSSNNNWFGGIPNRGDDYFYLRQLSYQATGKWVGGINNEWGCLVNNWIAAGDTGCKCSGYPSSDWDGYWYWTASMTSNDSNGKPLINYTPKGRPYTYDGYPNVRRVACVTP